MKLNTFIILFALFFCFFLLELKFGSDSSDVYHITMNAENREIHSTPIKCTITAYSDDSKETDFDPDITAIMEGPVSGWTCAVSKDLIGWLGARIYIENIGIKRVNDVMNGRWSKRIDIFIGDKKKAQKFGKKTARVVYIEKQ